MVLTMELRTVSTFKDLIERGHTERDVLRTHAREVEGVERHLRRGLAHGLRREHAAHLRRRGPGLHKSGFDLADEPACFDRGDGVVVAVCVCVW